VKSTAVGHLTVYSTAYFINQMGLWYSDSWIPLQVTRDVVRRTKNAPSKGPSLLDTISNPHLLAKFELFLTEEWSQDNLDFYKAAVLFQISSDRALKRVSKRWDYDREKSKEELGSHDLSEDLYSQMEQDIIGVRKKAWKVYSTYLMLGASKEVALSAEITRPVHDFFATKDFDKLRDQTPSPFSLSSSQPNFRNALRNNIGRSLQTEPPRSAAGTLNSAPHGSTTAVELKDMSKTISTNSQRDYTGRLDLMTDAKNCPDAKNCLKKIMINGTNENEPLNNMLQDSEEKGVKTTNSASLEGLRYKGQKEMGNTVNHHRKSVENEDKVSSHGENQEAEVAHLVDDKYNKELPSMRNKVSTTRLSGTKIEEGISTTKNRAQSPFTIQTFGSRTPTPLREFEQEGKKGKKDLESFCAAIVQAARAIQQSKEIKIDESNGKFLKGERGRQDPINCTVTIDDDMKASELAFMTKGILPSKRRSTSQTGYSHKEYSKINKLQEEIWRCGSIFDKSRRSMYELMASDSHRRFVARLAGMSS